PGSAQRAARAVPLAAECSTDSSRMSARGNRPAGLVEWLAGVACDVDTGAVPAAEILPRLAGAVLARAGVPADKGGAGGDIVDAVATIAAVAEESLAAAFILWGQRT